MELKWVRKSGEDKLTLQQLIGNQEWQDVPVEAYEAPAEEPAPVDPEESTEENTRPEPETEPNPETEKIE